MSYHQPPRIQYPGLTKNALGLTVQDYQGGLSTLCAGCGHDSVSAALVQAFFELEIPPHRVAKLSGIGCSSKTPAYFLEQAHGFNSLHGRMATIASGANAANRDLHYVGVSGDGDSLSIGFGGFAHAVRRNVDMLYVIENNGVYGLTKGQFSASADIGTRAKKGEENKLAPIDPMITTISLGGSFVARGFSGDKDQLVPLLKAGLTHRGFSLVDVLSPCVTFNNHEGSTKSYAHARERFHQVVNVDFVPKAAQISAECDPGEAVSVTLHDGSMVRLRKTGHDYDPTDRAAAEAYIRRHQKRGEIVTGLLYVDEGSPDLHEVNATAARPLNDIPYEQLAPGAAGLDKLQEAFR